MKKIITERGVDHEVHYITSLPSKNPCLKEHEYERSTDMFGNEYKSCKRCGNLPINSL